MGKAIVYISLVIVCLGIGVLVGGLGVYYGKYYYDIQVQPTQERIEAKCFPRANGGGGTIDGQITITQTSNSNLKITALILGLPKKKLGFHVHENGIVDYKCSTAAGHFNPRNKNHGGPESADRHLGDLGNIDASQFPDREIEISDREASLFGEDSILGRSIVIHENEDDLINQSSAGGRIACCTIMRTTN